MIRALLTAVACIWLGTPALGAQDSPDAEAAANESLAPRIVALRAGFDGHFKVGYWTPFVVELEGASQPFAGRVELVVPDGDGVPTRVVAPSDGELSIGPGERKSVRLYARLGQLAAQATVGFRGSVGLLATRQFATQSDGPLRGVLPSSETLVVSLAAPDDREASARALRGVHLAAISDAGALPSDWWGYEGVDAVIVNTDDDAISSQLATPSPQLAALDQWVRLGGTLLVSVGRNAERVLAAGSPLADLAPGTFEAFVPLRQSSVLETYVETIEPISPDAPFEIRVPQLRDVRGKVEAYAGTHPRDLPLVVRTPRGFGQVVFVAFDLDRAPFAGWAARPQLVDKLLRGVRPAEHAESAGLGAVASLGYVDLAGQLRAALDQFDGVRPVPFWLVAVLITGYIAIIGPLDYYLVKHVFRRMEATWITFGVTVLVFCAGAYALAYGLKGTRVRANEIDVVDFDATSGLERGTSWSNVFSPRNETYNLSLATQPPPRGDGAGMLFSWFGLAGSGFGGMDVPGRAIGGIATASRTLPLFVEAYDYSPRLDALRHVPIAVWSSKTFVGRWWRQTAPPVEAYLADRDKLTGTLTNRLAAPLSNAVLIYDKWAYVIGTLEAGRELDIESVDPQTVHTYLRRVQARGDRQVAAAYDREAFDVPRIVEMMTAHDLAGGRNYTGLANEYEGFNELSSLVQNGRAVLFAQSHERAARLERDGTPLAGVESEGAQSQAWTFRRCVFPVAVEDSE
jgi:hypothetical protein